MLFNHQVIRNEPRLNPFSTERFIGKANRSSEGVTKKKRGLVAASATSPLLRATTPHRSCKAWRRSRRDNSRSWLWSVFNWRLRSSGRSGSWSSDSTATTGARSSSGIAAGSWSSIAGLPLSIAAPGPRSLAALDLRGLAAATSFGNATHCEHNTKRHRQTKQTIHPDLLRSQTRYQTRGDRPSAHPPPAAVLSLDRSARGILLRRLGNLLRVSPPRGSRISAQFSKSNDWGKFS